MGKIQYRVLALAFLGFLVGVVALSVSVHFSLTKLMQEEIKSSLDAIHTLKTRYVKSWVNSERASFDGLDVGSELSADIYAITRAPGRVDENNEAILPKLRDRLAEKFGAPVNGNISVTLLTGDVLFSTDSAAVGKVHHSWHVRRHPLNTQADGELRAFITMDKQLGLLLTRGLYHEGVLFAFLVLDRVIPKQYLLDFIQNLQGGYQVVFYDQEQRAFQLKSGQRIELLHIRAPNALSTEKNYWLEMDGWNPLSPTAMVGVWRWDDMLKLGIAVVGESNKAFRTLKIIQKINAGFMVCILMASFIIAWFFREYRKHRIDLEHQLEKAIELQAEDLSNERREKQTLVEALFQNSSDGYLVITQDSVIDCNPASVDMLEVGTSKRLVGKHPFTYSPSFQSDGEVSLEKAETLLQSVFETGYKRFEWEFETASRSKLYCLITITIVKYHGQMVGIMVWQNMTQAIESEKVLRESERKRRAILNATNHRLFVLDPYGRMVDLNSAAADWIQVEPQNVIGTSYWESASKILDAELLADIRRGFDAACDGTVFRFEADMIEGGAKHFLDFVLTPIWDEQNQLVMVIMEAYDISQIRNAEIAEKQARQLAEEVSQTKTNFLANMSHEIRTPMNAIIGLTKLCLNTPLSTRQRTMMESVDQASETLLNILNDILDFSKVESGKLEIELVTFSINDVLQTVSGLFSLKAEEKNIEFVVNNRAGGVSLIGDPLRIQQVLMNLCSNAIKFTDNGEVLLTVDLLQASHDRGLFRFSVQDTGIGLSEDQQSNLFEAFSQADSSTTRQFGGTGLGLAISRELVELMGGVLAVDSKVGEGSCFYFDLPLALLDDSEDPFDSIEPQSKTRVAVVDDNLVCIEVEKKILGKLGYDVQVFDSGESLLDYLKKPEADIEIVLIDWDMPGLDGCEASLKIKSRMGSRAPIVILVTGVSNELSPEYLVHYQLDGFVVKPVNPDVLAHVIDEARDKKLAKQRKRLDGDFALSHEPAVNVLVVEDNDINQMVVSNFLRETGVSAVVVANGQEALDYIEESEKLPDAVLMDLQMPVMDGFTATEKLREHYDAATLPIIAMTANVLASDREKAQSMGMNDMIAKPFDFQAFEWILKQWVDLPTSFVDKQETVAGDIDGVVEKGIDFEFGFKQFGNDRGVYYSVLNKFNVDFANKLMDMKAALNAGTLSDLEMLSHSMKGAAGNIGLSELGEALEGLERCAKNSDKAKQQLETVLELWPAIHGAIDRLLPLLVSDDSEILDALSNEELTHYLNAIADRLSQHEVLPADEVRHLKQMLFNRLDQTLVNKFVRALESFQTDDALDLLVVIVEQLLGENAS